MTGLRDFHTSVFDFATKVMTAVECQRGGSGMSSQVTATIAFAGDEVRRDITIACTDALNTGHRRCVVVWGNRIATMESEDEVAPVSVRSRAGPRMQSVGQGTTTRHQQQDKGNSK